MNHKSENAINDNISKCLIGLNPPQKEAVESINGPVLVVAGAGSGKTRVLTNRIGYILESGVAPWNVLALTFTNKAAAEMKERIGKLISHEVASKIWAGTFHSIFARILRMEAESIGFNNSFSIYDTDDSTGVIKSILTTYGNQQKIQPALIRNIISSSKNKLITSSDYGRNAQNSNEKMIADIFREYEIRLHANNAMDFDDLLINMIKLLRTSQDMLSKYQEKFRYILVDEYQDTNHSQYLAINMLAKAHQNVCVVGDDAQSIYKWRGADIQNILSFKKDYPHSKEIRLEQNYRSTKTILSAADSVIAKNSFQIKKKLWTDNIEGELIDVSACGDDKDEASRIVDKLKNQIKFEYSLKDIAILYRTNAQAMALENAMRAGNVPYIIVGGVSFYKRKEIKDVIAYLRLIVNQADGEALVRVVNEPPRGLGATSINRIKAYASEKSISLYEAFANADIIDDLQARAVNASKNFISMIKKYSDNLENSSMAELISDYIIETGLFDMYKEINTEESIDRMNNINQLLFDLKYFFRNNADNTLDDYLQQVSLISDIDEKDTNGNNVTLMTLHSAKGLEFPIVFITGLEQGLLPLTRNDSTKEDEEEERRLFYVGITRAKEKLFLTYAQRRMKFGEFSYQTPSKFLKEIPSHLFKNAFRDAVKTTPTPFIAPKKPFSTPNNSYSQISGYDDFSQLPPSEFDFSVGDRVKHQMFGIGKITGLSGTPAQRKATVHFNGVGKKELLLQYAKLQKV